LEKVANDYCEIYVITTIVAFDMSELSKDKKAEKQYIPSSRD